MAASLRSPSSEDKRQSGILALPLVIHEPRMRLHSPSMSELHAFVAVARLGSFTRAAEALCVTQGAVSRAVARLESHYGHRLLQRSAHRLELTEAGRELLDTVEEPLRAIETASERLRRGRDRHELALSVVPTLASVWLVPRLPDFQRAHPGVRLRFVPYRKNEDFAGETAPDAAVLSGLGREQWPHWSCDYVIGREVVPVCHPSRAEGRRWRTPAELAAEPLLYHANAPGNWAEWLQAAGTPGVRANLSLAFDQVSILIRAALADMGVALVQRCLVREELASGRLAAPFDLPVSLQHGYFLCCRPERRELPGLAAFRRWLLATAAAPASETAGT